MPIPALQHVRAAVTAAGTKLVHPTKNYKFKGMPDRVPAAIPESGEIPWGPVVYVGHEPYAGNVGVLVDGKYLWANGEDHPDSLMALAHHLGLELESGKTYDNGVTVDEVTREEFYRRCVS